MFSIGCDPEMFVRDIDTKELFPCIGILGGTKEAPIPVNNGAVQEDNVMAEFNVTPATSADEFVSNIMSVRKQIRVLLKAFNLEEHIIGSAHFPMNKLTHPQALVFGCEPDYNAWTGHQNPRPGGAPATLRTAGGHIHVGNELVVDAPEAFVQLLDLLIGVPSVIFDQDSERRQLYGKAGAFRFKPYGAEYRTVSNFWIKEVESIKWVYKQVSTAVTITENVLAGYKPSTWGINDVNLQLAQRAINENNKNLAAYLIDTCAINIRGLV